MRSAFQESSLLNSRHMKIHTSRKDTFLSNNEARPFSRLSRKSTSLDDRWMTQGKCRTVRQTRVSNVHPGTVHPQLHMDREVQCHSTCDLRWIEATPMRLCDRIQALVSIAVEVLLLCDLVCKGHLL